MYQKITKEQTINKIKEGAILIDVRTNQEYLQNHIEHSINIPLSNIVNVLNKIDKNKTIIIYCSTGKRSYKACKSLISLGYLNVYDLGSINNY